MAKDNLHRLYPEGRRHPAPPRRLPPPANDNRAPMRELLKRYAVLAVIAAMAISVVLNAV